MLVVFERGQSLNEGRFDGMLSLRALLQVAICIQSSGGLPYVFAHHPQGRAHNCRHTVWSTHKIVGHYRNKVTAQLESKGC